jgi:fused signal recognition particle receptor
MPEQSHRDEMNAAIRAQRERHAVPRSIAGEPDPEPVEAVVEPEPQVEPEPEPEPEPKKKGFFSRLFG